MDDSSCFSQELSQKILTLYDQIEASTIENLEIAQKNAQLEVQISTLDEILNSAPSRADHDDSFFSRNESSLQGQYDNLLNDHLQLRRRVKQIEGMISHPVKPEERRKRKTATSRVASTDCLGVTQRRSSNLFKGEGSLMSSTRQLPPRTKR